MADEKLAPSEPYLATHMPMKWVIEQIVQAHLDVPERRKHEADYDDHDNEIEHYHEHDE